MKHSSVTLSQLYEYYEVAALVEGATKKKCRSAFKQLKATFRDIQASSLTVPMIGQYQMHMKEAGLAVATVRSYFAAASEVYSWGAENGLLAENPFAAAKKMRAVRREVQILTADELEDFLKAAAEKDRRDPTAKLRWYLLIEIGSTSGLRAGELQNQRWEDIDLEAGVIRVRYRPDLFGQHWQWGSKGKTDRDVPLSQAAMDGLHRLREIAPWRYPFLKRVTCERLLKRVGSIPEATRKQPYTNFYRELRQIKALADLRRKARGLPPIKNGGLHILRKTAITGWVRHGATMPDIQDVAGHRSFQTTRDAYIAVLRSEAVEKTNSLIMNRSCYFVLGP